jgi:hypothetical protein
MFRVRWERRALDELTDLWTRVDSTLRNAITVASNEIDQLLRTNPLDLSESRPNGRRILFVPPLGLTFRVDGQTVSVLRIWLFRKRAK